MIYLDAQEGRAHLLRLAGVFNLGNSSIKYFDTPSISLDQSMEEALISYKTLLLLGPCF
jgi:hypothetical protein